MGKFSGLGNLGNTKKPDAPDVSGNKPKPDAPDVSGNKPKPGKTPDGLDAPDVSKLESLMPSIGKVKGIDLDVKNLLTKMFTNGGGAFLEKVLGFLADGDTAKGTVSAISDLLKGGKIGDLSGDQLKSVAKAVLAVANLV